MQGLEGLLGDFDDIIRVAKQSDEKLKGVKTDSRPWSFRDDFEKNKSILEGSIPRFLASLRGYLDKLPKSLWEVELVSKEKSKDDAISQTYQFKKEVFDDLIKAFNHIKLEIEGDNGVYETLKSHTYYVSRLKDLRISVISFIELYKLLTPKDMISVEREVEIILKLRDLDLVEPADLLESVIIDPDNKANRLLNIRSALEKVLVSLLEKKGKTVKPSFFANLHECIKHGLIEKLHRKSIGASYSFISKLIHRDLEESEENVQYSISQILLIIEQIVNSLGKTQEG